MANSTIDSPYLLPVLNTCGKSLTMAYKLASDDNDGEGLASTYKVLVDTDGNSVFSSTADTATFPESVPPGYSESNLPTNGSTSFLLKETYTSSDGSEQTMLVYDLVFFQSPEAWLSPVLNTSAINIMGWTWGRQKYSDNTTLREKVLTIYSTDVDVMNKTARFLQTIQAYPNGKLASDYNTAMANAQSAVNSAAGSSAGDSIQKMEDAVTDVTSQYDAYRGVTLQSITLMSGYWSAVPFVYTGYKKKQYFYFYNSNGVFVGRFDMILSSDTVSVSDKNGGFTCTYYPASNGSDGIDTFDVDTGNGIDIGYKNGVFSDDDGTQFYVKGGFTIKQGTTSTIIPALAGSVGGHSTCGAMGSDETSDDLKKKDSTAWQKAKSEWQKMGPISKAMTLVMAIQMGPHLLSFLKSVSVKMYEKAVTAAEKLGEAKDWLKKKLTKDDMEDITQSADNDIATDLSAQEAFNTKTENGIEVQKDLTQLDISSEATSMGERYSYEVFKASADYAQTSINDYSNQLQELVELGNTSSDVLEAAQELGAAKQKLQQIDPEADDAMGQLSEVFKDLSSMNTKLQSLDSATLDQVGMDQSQLEDSASAYDDYWEKIDNETNAQENRDSSNPDDEAPDIDSDPVIPEL